MIENEPMDIGDADTTCGICYAEFLDPEDLNVHISQVHAPVYTKECRFCTSVFADNERYALHIRDEHITSMQCCKYCTKSFIDLDRLRRHERKHVCTKKYLFNCSQCMTKFTNIFDLEQHEYRRHNNDLDGVMLHEMYPLLSMVLNVKSVTFLQSLGSSTVYICSNCEYTSPIVDEYLHHLRVKDCKSIVCDKCSNVYRDRSGLVKHIGSSKACHGFVSEKDSTRTCKKCKRNINALCFSEHIKHCKPIKCTVCASTFISVNKLSEHQAKEHPLAITLTTCQFCRREFVGNVALQKHVDRTHKSKFHLYKYACTYCETTYFKHPNNLFGHFFSTHPQIHPFFCKICDKSFRLRKKFTIHIKLIHNSVGFVEFDERYHVFFSDKKSENPFIPTSLLVDYSEEVQVGHETEAEQVEQTDKDTDAALEQTDRETDAAVEQTDRETDVEIKLKRKMSETDRKPLKLRFKKQNKANLVNPNSDFMSATENEGNHTEVDTKPEPKLREKRKCKSLYSKPSKVAKKEVMIETENEMIESEDEPLLIVKKRQKMKSKVNTINFNKKQRSLIKMKPRKKAEFTCSVCDKYCYTYQNYNHHMSLHLKNEVKKCIKCAKEFRTEAALNKHIETEHASSKLTETLKNLLERRKQGSNYIQPQLSMAEKFHKTIKKVRSAAVDSAATLTEVTDKLSVQKFIESFTPETNAAGNEVIKNKPLELDTVVTMKTLSRAIKKPPLIKMKKFVPKPINTNVRLAMPVRFKNSVSEPQKVSLRIVQRPTIIQQPIKTQQPTISTTNLSHNDDTYENYHDDSFVDYEEVVDNARNDTVPEVAQEVLLEETVEQRPVIPHKIILPKLPKGYKQIRIAHLQREAPYFKIVKVDEMLNKQKNNESEEDEEVQLPHGTKLVNVNPLAHLLGDTPVEQVIGEPKKRYYKPKTSNFEQAIAKALLQLENPSAYPKKKSNKKTSLEVEQ